MDTKRGEDRERDDEGEQTAPKIERQVEPCHRRFPRRPSGLSRGGDPSTSMAEDVHIAERDGGAENQRDQREVDDARRPER